MRTPASSPPILIRSLRVGLLATAFPAFVLFFLELA